MSRADEGMGSERGRLEECRGRRGSGERDGGLESQARENGETEKQRSNRVSLIIGGDLKGEWEELAVGK